MYVSNSKPHCKTKETETVAYGIRSRHITITDLEIQEEKIINDKGAISK